MRAAELFASSDLVPGHYRNKVANCFIAINRAQRLGIDELYFFEKTYIVKGKLGLATELAIELANTRLHRICHAGVGWRSCREHCHLCHGCS